MISLRAVIAAWLKAFQGSRVGVGMNGSARVEVLSALSGPIDCTIYNIPLLLCFLSAQ